MASIYDANTNYQVNNVDLQANPGFVTREYLIDVYPSLIDNFRFAGLWAWGTALTGDNTSVNKSSPVQTVAGGTNWKQVSAGKDAFAAIKTDGTLWIWGSNLNGKLGDNTIVDKSSPVQTVSGATTWKQVSIGYLHSAAVKTDNTLWTWGYNAAGQLGNNNLTNRSSPVQTISVGTDWKQVSCGLISGTSATRSATAAVKTDGTLWLWGGNADGQLGDGSRTDRSSPVQTISVGSNWKQVSGGPGTFAAIKTDGTLWLWGINSNGLMGDNTVTSRSSPVQTTSGGSNWKQVSAGDITAAIKTDGTLWAWGGGLTGDDTTVNRSSPVQTVTGGTNWKQVSASTAAGGIGITAAIKTDGTLWTWGTGLTGDDTTVDRSSPVQTVAGGTNWKQVSTGDNTAAAIRDDSSDPFRSDPL